MPETAYIYTLSDPRSGFVRYVGKTFFPGRRYYDHIADFKRTKTPKTSWIKSLHKLGLKPVFEIIETLYNAESDEWEEAERFWISSLSLIGCNLTNSSSGGESGKRLSQLTKKKIGEHSKKRVHSAETKAKISASCKARMTEDEKRRLSLKCKGFRHTPEMKAYLSKIKKGIKRSPKAMAILLEGSIKWKREQGFKMKDNYPSVNAAWEKANIKAAVPY